MFVFRSITAGVYSIFSMHFSIPFVFIYCIIVLLFLGTHRYHCTMWLQFPMSLHLPTMRFIIMLTVKLQPVSYWKQDIFCSEHKRKFIFRNISGICDFQGNGLVCIYFRFSATYTGFIKIRRKIVPCPFWCYGANPNLHRMRFRIPRRLINALIFNRNVLFACWFFQYFDYPTHQNPTWSTTIKLSMGHMDH